MPVVGTTAFSTAIGSTAEDQRNNGFANPLVYFHLSTAAIYAYNIPRNAFEQVTLSFGAAGGTGEGAKAIIVPSLSPSGTLAAGGTTTKITLNTALPASINQGRTKGFRIRIIGSGAGGTGKVEERTCTGNDAGTQPTITLDEPISGVPVAGDRYEFLTGSYVFLGTGALAANQFRRLDILTQSLSSLSTTGLIATVPSQGNVMFAMDEGHVPADRLCYEGKIVGASTYDTGNTLTGGVKKCLLSTATGANTITGQAAGGDFAIKANRFRNCQVRVVEDTLIPTAAGQRARIVSHTGGAGTAPVYTIQIAAGGWAVQPSAVCKFVIEEWTDNIIFKPSGSLNTYNYTIANNYTGINTGNQWETTTWAASGANLQVAGAFGCHAFGLVNNEDNTCNPSSLFIFRGASRTFDYFDLTGGATGAWTNGLTIVGWDGTISASDYVHSAYNPHTQEGRYLYFFNQSSSSTINNQRPFIRFDCAGRGVELVEGIPNATGQSVFSSHFAWVTVDQGTPSIPAEKIAYYNTARPLIMTDFWQLETH